MNNSSPQCTLSPEELDARRHELLPGLVARAEGVSDLPQRPLP